MSIRKQLLQKIKKTDLKILLPVLIMIIFGILMVYSASSYLAAVNYGDSQFFLKRQAINAVVGLVLMGIIYLLPLKHFRNRQNIMWATIILIGALVFVLAFTEPINGAKGWIRIGGFSIQPAEFAKLVVIIYFSYVLSRRGSGKQEGQKLPLFISSLLVIGTILFLIMIQPDMGTVLIIGAIVFIMYLSSGIELKYSLLYAGLALALVLGVFGLVYHFGESLPFIQRYQYERFLGFWDPFAVSDNEGLQLINSYYALARGGLNGVGPGQSVQKTGYLPEPYTDFIVSIIGEELGWIGIVGLLVVYMYLVIRIFRIALKSKDTFNSLLALGIGAMFLIQATVNVGGVVGLLPITGVTFPFISYGGSSMLVSTLAIGLVLNVSYRERWQQAKEKAHEQTPRTHR